MSARRAPIKNALGLAEDFTLKDLSGEQRVALVCWFFGTFCRHIKGPIAGQTIRFEDWQLEHLIAPVFGTLDRYKRRKYTTAVWGLPRKHMKSLIGSGIGLYGLIIEAIFDPGAEVYAIASKKDQAQKVFRPAKMMVDKDPFLSAYCKVYKDVIYVPELESEFRVLAADAAGEHGGSPMIYIIDELHAHPNNDMFEAMSTGTTVRREPLGLIITTAGTKRKGPLWELLQKKPGRREHRYWIGADENDPVGDPRTWRKANIASWVSQQWLRDQYEDPKLSIAGFEAYNLNRFPMSAGSGRAFSASELAPCRRQPKLDPERPVYVTVDGADKSDHFAIGITQKDEAGVIHHEATIFAEPPAEKGYYDLALIEDILVQIHEAFDVARCGLDPNRLRMLMIRLQDVHGLEVEEFPQTNRHMCPACSALRVAVREGRLRYGRNARLQEHMENAVELPREPFGWRIGKASDDEKIDGAITLAMGVAYAEFDDDAPSFAETGGIYTIGG